MRDGLARSRRVWPPQSETSSPRPASTEGPGTIVRRTPDRQTEERRRHHARSAYRVSLARSSISPICRASRHSSVRWSTPRNPRRVACRVLGHAAHLEFAASLIEMKADFIAQLVVDPVRTQERAKAKARDEPPPFERQRRRWRHRRTRLRFQASFSFTSAEIAVDNRSQFADSFSRCRRPGRVSE